MWLKALFPFQNFSLSGVLAKSVEKDDDIRLLYDCTWYKCD